jgi:hypothetical protein
MTYNPDFKQQEIARHAFNLKRRLAPTARQSDRVTDNRASWHLRRTDHDSARTPTREAHKTLAASHERVSLILQNLLIWGAVAWMAWYVFL